MRRHIAWLAAVTLAACNVNIKIDGEDGLPGSGVEATASRDVGPFTRVRIDGAGTLVLTRGEATPLTIVGDDNIVPLIDTTVTDGELVIRPSESISPEIDLVFRASAPELTAVECAGAAQIEVNDLDAQEFKILLRGAASAEATGAADTLGIELSGAGRVDTLGLVARDVTVDLRGAGSASVHTSETLAVSISGVGRVTYAGDGELVKKEIAGLGLVSRE